MICRITNDKLKQHLDDHVGAELETSRVRQSTNLWNGAEHGVRPINKIINWDFKGFDSSLISRDGIPRSMGNFPEA